MERKQAEEQNLSFECNEQLIFEKLFSFDAFH